MRINSISDFRRAVRIPYAWPGGYPTYFVCNDGAALCHACVKRERRNILEAVTTPHDHSGWRVAYLDINYEDNQLYCDNCNERI